MALAADPGYPVYTGGPLLAGAEAVLMPLLPERGFAPDLDAIGGDVAERARLMYLNYPNNPTGAIVPDGLFERAVEFGREHDVLIVHDASYTETTFDGYVAPSFLETPGAKEVGVEVFSLSKGWNMTGWRTAAIVGNAEAVAAYWKLKTNIDSGMFDAVQLAAVAALDAAAARRCARSTSAAATWSATPCRDRRGRDAAEGDDLRLGAGAGGPHLGVLLRAGARGIRRGGFARRLLRPERRGLLPDLADRPRRAAAEAVERLRASLGGRRALLRRGSDAGRAPAGDARGGAHARAADPPERDLLRAGLAEQVAAELRSLGEVVVAMGAPLPGRPAASSRAAAWPPQP